MACKEFICLSFAYLCVIEQICYRNVWERQDDILCQIPINITGTDYKWRSVSFTNTQEAMFCQQIREQAETK